MSESVKTKIPSSYILVGIGVVFLIGSASFLSGGSKPVQQPRETGTSVPTPAPEPNPASSMGDRLRARAAAGLEQPQPTPQEADFSVRDYIPGFSQKSASKPKVVRKVRVYQSLSSASSRNSPDQMGSKNPEPTTRARAYQQILDMFSQQGQPEASQSSAPPSHMQRGVRFAPAGPALLPGTVIEGVLDQMVVSDYPGGYWRGRVARNVYDMRTNTLLIPAGSILIGPGQSLSSIHDRRIALALSRIVTNTGMVIEMPTPLEGPSGVAGVDGEYKSHAFTRLMGYAAYGLFGIAPGLAIENGEAQSSQDEATRQLTQGAQRVAQQITSKYTDRLPTITGHPGDRFSITVFETVEF